MPSRRRATTSCGRLHRCWLSIHPEPDLLPGRRHFDPVMVPRLLPRLWLLDVRRAPLRFRYRLVGTVHIETGGEDPTGQWLDETHPAFAASPAFPQYRAVAQDRMIAFYRGMPTYVIQPPT
jgi:hypothetical protein